MLGVLVGLNKGSIRISRGELDALGLAGGVSTMLNAINRDYSYDWMSQPYRDAFDSGWLGCGQAASNIDITALAQWRPGYLRDT